MEAVLVGIVGIATIIAAGIFAGKLGVAAPILLILFGVGYSFIPGAPTEIPPELILVGLLPPILYSSAINVPVVDFRRNFVSISGLSVILVIVSAFVTGYILYRIFPDLSFAAGIAIGAVISPTDAVAAMAIGKKLGLPPRLVTILEGEGLVNDATALVLLRSAVAAIATTVSFWGSIGDFAYAVIAAVVIGLLVGFVTVLLRSRLSDPILDTAISLAIPFIAYLPAEELHASGVISVVVAGLYSGHSVAQRLSPQARIAERLNWRTLQFVLENGVFLLMGLEISRLIHDVQSSARSGEPGVLGSVLLGLLMTAVLIVLRVLFVPPLLLFIRTRNSAAEKQHSRSRQRIDQWLAMAAGMARLERRAVRVEKMYTRRENDLEQRKAEQFGWRGAAVLSWSGMRGVVTLAAAQSLPIDSQAIPYRAQLILIAFTVAVVTLILQGGTLPLLIRLIGIEGRDRDADRRQLASLLDEMSSQGVEVLDNPKLTLPDGEAIDDGVIEKVKRDSLLVAESAWERADHGAGIDALIHSPQRQYRELRREVLAAEREVLLEARASGSYASRILNRAQAMLDLEETRLEAIDNPNQY